MLKVSLRSLLSHKLRLALTALAIVLGVSFVAGTLIITDTINGIFSGIFSTASQGVAVVVRGQVPHGADQLRGQRRAIDESVLATVRGVSGVRSAYPVIFREGADLIGSDGKVVGGTQGPPHFGTNWIADSQVSPYRLRQGRAPQSDGDVVVDAGTASTAHLSVGDSATIVIDGGSRHTFNVSGVAGYGSANNLAGASILLFTLHTVQTEFDAAGKLDSIDVSAQPGVSATDLRDRVAHAVPSSVDVATGNQVAAQASSAAQSIINSFIGTPLLVFAIISLFVGSFLIVNTFTILVTQRTREIALLRALGATRRQVLTSVLVEAGITGAVMSAVGALVGVLIAKGLYSILDRIGFGLPKGNIQLLPRTFIVAILVGTAVTLGAALPPARRATRVAPVAALREAEPELAGVSRRRVAAGAVTTLAGAALLGLGLFGNTGETLQLLGIGALVLFIGVAVLSPVLVQPVAGVLGAPAAALRGVPGRLAQANARRSPRRTASTAAALMIGVALVAGVDVIAESIKVSSQAAVTGSVPGQVIAISERNPLSPSAADALRRSPSLADVSEIRDADVTVGNAEQSVFALGPEAVGRTISFDAASGDPRSALAAGQFIVDTGEAGSNGWVVGTRVPVTFLDTGRTVRLRLGATYRANALLSGVIVSLDTFDPNVTSVRDFGIIANGAPGVSANAALNAAMAALSSYPTVKVQSRAQFIKAQEDQITSLQNLIFVLLFLAIVIAFFGIVNTLALSIIERTRELGLLRAMGLTRAQMRSMVRWEAVIIALLGAALGLVVGLGLGIAVVRALAGSGIGHLGIPAGELVVCVIVALILGVAAAVFPALRASRLNVLAAIATE